jgi:hypothetical protein
MVVAAVVVSDDVATVDLTKAVRTAPTRQRQLLLSQLLATLGQLSNIGTVQITVGRAALDIPPGVGNSSATDPSEVDIQPAANPGVDGRPVVIDSKGRLARLDGRTLEVVKDVGELSAVPGANRPAVSKDSSAYAVLNAARSKLMLQLPGTRMVTLVKSTQLSAPSFDPLGWVWTGSGAEGGPVYAARSDAPAVKVKAPWLKRDELVSLRISRDGTRALIAVRQHGQAHLFVSGVIREADGRPVSLTDPIGLVPDLTSVTDAAWVDDGEVVVLGKRSSVPKLRPWLVQIGGTISATTPVPGAESIAAGNGESSVLATTSTGTQGRSGVLWYRVSSARWPAFPG